MGDAPLKYLPPKYVTVICDQKYYNSKETQTTFIEDKQNEDEQIGDDIEIIPINIIPNDFVQLDLNECNEKSILMDHSSKCRDNVDEEEYMRSFYHTAYGRYSACQRKVYLQHLREQHKIKIRPLIFDIFIDRANRIRARFGTMSVDGTTQLA
ncbi:unnamed protein product [Rotaria sp. Silwood1]|nr:unnamed protein product [Rotaria sp. Silwood1]